MKDITSRENLGMGEIYASFFQGHDMGKVFYFWETISKIASVPAGKIRPQDNFIDLYPQSKWCSVSVEGDDLTDLVLKASKGREIPKDFKMVGAIVKFLAGST